jgi:hypothetical protein
MLVATRPEKSDDMNRLVHAIREAAVAPARNGELNLAEVTNAFASALASILVGAYLPKHREAVLLMYPDLVRAYFPQWEKIYASHNAAPEKEKASTPR